MKLDLSIDWEHVVYVRLITTETISCPICMSTNNDMFLPKILRCHHILCLSCLLTYYIDCKQCCPLCNRNICLKEIKRIDIDFHEVHTGDLIDLVLLKKDTKTYKIDFYKSQIYKEEHFDDFLSNIKWDPKLKLEEIFLADLQKIYTDPHMSDLDPIIVEFSEFLQMQALEKLHTNVKQFPQLGRKTPKNNVTKNAQYYYLYQMIQGYNVFLHPMDVEYLLKSVKFDADKLEPILFVR